MSVIAHFSKDYAEARLKFLAAAHDRGLEVQSNENPKTNGPAGEPLFTDITTLGERDAKNHLLFVSATHGVEGFCGSACQTAFLESATAGELPSNLAITIIHVLNPHGFAWLRRVNEDNVDLNRNFVDFTKPLPENPGYKALRGALVPKNLDDETMIDAGRAVTKFGKEHGFDRMQEAITRGQYVDAQGLYYGGTEPTWSNQILRGAIQGKTAKATRIGLIDFHTGLGPYGYGEVITEYEPNNPAFDRAKSWYGEGNVTSTVGGDSSSAALVGTTDHAIHQEIKDREVTAIALEFGTRPSNDVFNATRADNWVHLFGDLDSAEGRVIKAQIRDAFYPDKDDWKEMVWTRAEEIIRLAIAGITK